jgi:hypothetical protein
MGEQGADKVCEGREKHFWCFWRPGMKKTYASCYARYATLLLCCNPGHLGYNPGMLRSTVNVDACGGVRAGSDDQLGGCLTCLVFSQQRHCLSTESIIVSYVVSACDTRAGHNVILLNTLTQLAVHCLWPSNEALPARLPGSCTGLSCMVVGCLQDL